MTRPNGSGHAHQQRDGAAEKRRFLGVADLADILDVRRNDEVANLGLEIVLVDLVDLGGDLERYPAALGDADRLVDPLFRRDASEKCKIRRSRGLRHEQPLG